MTTAAPKIRNDVAINDLLTNASQKAPPPAEVGGLSTLNHNLAYCYNDARVIKWLWSNVVKNKFQGGVRSFED